MKAMPLAEGRLQKLFRLALFIPPTLLLVLYPGALFANLMALAAFAYEEAVLQKMLFAAFIFLTTVYPLVLGVSFFRSRNYTSMQQRALYITIPYFYLLIVYLLFLLLE